MQEEQTDPVNNVEIVENVQKNNEVTDVKIQHVEKPIVEGKTEKTTATTTSTPKSLPTKSPKGKNAFVNHLVHGVNQFSHGMSTMTIPFLSKKDTIPHNGQIQKHIHTSKNGFEWIDIARGSCNMDEFRQFIEAVAVGYGLHETSVKDCLSPTHLPKIEKIEDVTFIVTRYVDPNCKFDSDTIQQLTNKITLFIGKTFLITVHRADSIALLDKVKENWEEEFTNLSQNHLINYFLDKILETYKLNLENSNEMLDDYEIRLFSNESSIVKDLYHLKRRSAVFKRMLKLTRDLIVNRATAVAHPVMTSTGDGITPLSTPRIQYKKSPSAFHSTDPFVQDLVDEVESIKFFAEELEENCGNLLELHISLASHQTNELVTVLTVFSAFFIPLTFLAGVYGMNFDYMPELRWKGSYPLLVCIMAVITVIVFIWLKSKKFI